MRTLPHQELIVVRPSSIHGSGVYAAKGIKRETRIIEYVGEIISSKEADRRYDDEAMKVHHTFLFYLDEDSCIDAAKGGNESRFINHSCRPNCVAHMKRGRIYIYALKNIRKGDELTYDYNYTREGEYDPSWDKLYACRCGATNCRGTILQLEEEPPAARVTRKRERAGRAKAK
jgi:SET domain-containing protein